MAKKVNSQTESIEVQKCDRLMLKSKYIPLLKRSLYQLAGEIDAPILALSQVSRGH